MAEQLTPDQIARIEAANRRRGDLNADQLARLEVLNQRLAEQQASEQQQVRAADPNLEQPEDRPLLARVAEGAGNLLGRFVPSAEGVAAQQGLKEPERLREEIIQFGEATNWQPNEEQLNQFIQKQEQIVGSQRGITGNLASLINRTPETALRRTIEKEFETAAEQRMGDLGALAETTARGAATIVPAALGAGASGLAGRAVQAGKIGGTTGLLTTAADLFGGDTLEDATKRGLATGLISAGLSAGIDAASPVLKKVGNAVLKSMSKVKNWAVQRAINRPEIFTKARPDLITAGNSLLGTLDDYAAKTSQIYDDMLNQIDVPDGTVIDVSGVSNAIKKSKAGVDDVISMLKSARKKELVDISDNAIDRLVRGGNLSFDEAKTINKLLHGITKTGKSEVVGSSALGRLSEIKNSLLESMNNQVPGIRDVNRAFATRTELVNKVGKALRSRDGDLKESTIKSLAEEFTRGGKNKAQLLRQTQQIVDDVGSDALEEVADVAALDAFANAAGVSYGDIVFGGILGAGGGAAAGPSGAAAGFASTALRSPMVTEGIIRGTTAAAPALGATGRAAAAQGGSQTSRQLLRREQ